MKRPVHIPDLGDFHDVEVIEVNAQPGDMLAAEAPVVTLESDKAAMEVPAPFGGKVVAVHVKAGDKVNQGDLVAELETEAESDSESATTAAASTEVKAESDSASATTAATAATAKAESVVEEAAASTTTVSAGAMAKAESATASTTAASTTTMSTAGVIPHAGPGVRRFARELGVELSQVAGSGPKGRIVKSDVEAHVKRVMQTGGGSVVGIPAAAFAAPGGGLPEMPAVDFSAFGEVEVRPLARIRKLSGANLRRNWLVAPHVTQHEEADVTELESFRKSLADEAKAGGFKMTPLAFLVLACAKALREFPEFNASLDPSGENLILKKYCNIGVAVDTPQGLVVPVLRDADAMGAFAVARALAEVSGRAREGKLKREDMQGGCFTISSLGGIGGTAFSPIINCPEVAILGVARAHMKPQWNGKEFVPRLMMPLSLSYDHRVIDGAHGARFIVRLRTLLSDLRRLAL